MPNMKSRRQRSYEVRKLVSPYQLAMHNGTTSCHQKHLLSLKRPLVIESISYHQGSLLLHHRKISHLWEHLLSSGVPLIIRKTSRLREYLLLLERPLLVAPLFVDSHFCQTGSVISTDTRYGFMSIRQKCFVEFFLQDSDNDLIFKINHS